MLKNYIISIWKLFKKNPLLNVLLLFFTAKQWRIFIFVHVIFYFLGLINLLWCRNLYTSNPIHFASFKILLSLKLLKKKSLSKKIDFVVYVFFVWIFSLVFGVSLKSIQLCVSFTNLSSIFIFKEGSKKPTQLLLNFVKKEFTAQMEEDAEIRIYKILFKIHRHTDK